MKIIQLEMHFKLSIQNSQKLLYLFYYIILYYLMLGKENELFQTQNILEEIENIQDVTELESYLSSLSNSDLSGISSYKITHLITKNENIMKNLIMSNTENIIKLFSNIKEIKEETFRSKRNLDTLSSQMIM